MSVSCEYCVLSGSGLCNKAEHSSRGVLPSGVCVCVCVCVGARLREREREREREKEIV